MQDEGLLTDDDIEDDLAIVHARKEAPQATTGPTQAPQPLSLIHI